VRWRLHDFFDDGSVSDSDRKLVSFTVSFGGDAEISLSITWRRLTVMENFKVPGVMWVIFMVLLLTIVRVAVTDYGVDPLYFDLAVVIAFAVLKAFNIGTKELEELLDIIKKLQTQLSGHAESTARMAMTEPERVRLSSTKEPNKLIRWLVG